MPTKSEDSPRLKGKPSPLAERLAREVHKIEAKLKAKGIPVPKHGSTPLANQQGALRPVTSPSGISARPSATDVALDGVDEQPCRSSLSSPTPDLTTGSSQQGSGVVSDASRQGKATKLCSPAGQGAQSTSPEQELASYLSFKPPTLRLNLHGRDTNGQRPKTPPPPPPPPTPPPLTNVQRLDRMLEAHIVNATPILGRQLPAPDQHPFGQHPHKRALLLDVTHMDSPEPSAPTPQPADNISHSASTSPQPKGAGVAGAAVSDWGSGAPKCLSLTPDGRGWSAFHASEAGLGDVRPGGRSVASAQAGAGRTTPLRPAQRVDQAVECVAVGAIALRAAQPEQVVTMRDHSQFLTTLWPADPYSRDPTRVSLGSMALPQTAATSQRRSHAGSLLPLAELEDTTSSGQLRRKTDEAFMQGSNGGVEQGEAEVSSRRATATRFAAACDEDETSAPDVPALTLRQRAATAVLGHLYTDSFSPRASRKGPIAVVRRQAQALVPELVEALAPGDPGMGRTSRLVTPVHDTCRRSKCTREASSTSPNSGWGRVNS